MSRRKGAAAEAYDRARVEALWEKQAELGMSTAAFCAAEGLDARAYNRWKGLLLGLPSRRLSEARPEQAPEPRQAFATSQRSRSEPTSEAPLVEVTSLLAPSARAETGVEVIMADGIRLRLAPGFDPETLRRAVEALR